MEDESLDVGEHPKEAYTDEEEFKLDYDDGNQKTYSIKKAIILTPLL